VEQAWRGQPSGPFAGKPLLMDDETRRVLTAFWGQPASGAIQVIEASALVKTAWEQRPSWAIVPFEALEPRWKVLTIDGTSPIRKNFDPTSYPLSIPISLEGEAQVADLAAQMFGPTSGNRLVPSTNRDPSKLATLAMTGVTALVRATAYAMETQGINYPAIDIGEWLREADLTHVSNEVPFAENCPPPNPVQTDMRFCSNPRYIELMETISTDIVEMSGDHFADWGTDAMLYTLDLYKQHGWLYYGGGVNLEEGRKAVTLEYHGNRLAFIGCNGKGGSFATASATNPGAVPCDFDYMHAEITRLRSEGFLPIATFQHFEYYTYQAQPDQIRDFRGMAEAGAVIVSGSQAHQPQAIEFYPEETLTGGTPTSAKGAFIHYGLGNLFFDQYDVSQACRQAFIDRHIFYNNRYISTELLPMMFVDYARPRPMTADEEAELLQNVFSASGW
jgi:poly-gamma-glutamate synthesis protein (capsule biosynthesis protein)